MADSGMRLTAVNSAAEALGLHPGMPLADARAIHPPLEIAAADAPGDEAALIKLALWARRFSPLTRAEQPDGFTIDITGCAHLFGGEDGLIDDLARHLDRFGLTAQVALAPSIGAAWAFAHFSAKPRVIVHENCLRRALAPLPIAALRIDADARQGLQKVGLKYIGDLLEKPRAPLATRFGKELLLRLHQALGEDSETFHALTPAPLTRVAQHFADPLLTLQDLEHVTHLLTRELGAALQRLGKSARHVELTLFRVDGWSNTLPIRTSRGSQDGAHFSRLFCGRLDRFSDHAGFGFEFALLCAFETERADHTQHCLHEDRAEVDEAALTPLIDRLVNRFGPHSVARFVPRASYIPERAAGPVSVMRERGPTKAADWHTHARALYDGTPFGRPLLLFVHPEPIDVIVEMPDNPPERFEWRRIPHRVARAEGPERLGPEWWRTGGDTRPATRDYYRIEDEAGQRFWIFREGLYDRQTNTPRWFVHGVFP